MDGYAKSKQKKENKMTQEGALILAIIWTVLAFCWGGLAVDYLVEGASTKQIVGRALLAGMNGVCSVLYWIQWSRMKKSKT